MARASIDDILAVGIGELFEAIVQYKDYPKFVDNCTSVEVDRKSDREAHVTYKVSLIKDIEYKLKHIEDEAAKSMSWGLVQSEFLKRNSGKWILKSVGPKKTQVHYEIDVEFKIPVPTFILKKLISASLPKMIKSFETYILSKN